MTDLSCACPVTDVQAMGAVRERGLNRVAVLKRTPVPLVCLNRAGFLALVGGSFTFSKNRQILAKVVGREFQSPKKTAFDPVSQVSFLAS